MRMYFQERDCIPQEPIDSFPTNKFYDLSGEERQYFFQVFTTFLDQYQISNWDFPVQKDNERWWETCPKYVLIIFWLFHPHLTHFREVIKPAALIPFLKDADLELLQKEPKQKINRFEIPEEFIDVFSANCAHLFVLIAREKEVRREKR
jgi:hypothetical protein